MAGRPRKTIPEGSSQVTVELPDTVIALMDAAMAVRGMKYRGAFIRQLIEAHALLLPIASEQASEIEETREMFREIVAMMRVVQTTQADLMRALDVDAEAEAAPTTWEEFHDEVERQERGDDA
jgi:hypothetical protein